MSLSLPLHPGERDRRRGAAWPSAKTSAMLGDAWGLQSGLLPGWPLATGGTERHRYKLPCDGVIGWSGTKSLDSPFSLWCYSHKSSYFFCLNCFSIWIALGCVGWVCKTSVSHQDCNYVQQKMLLVGKTSEGVWGEGMGACGLLACVCGCGTSTECTREGNLQLCLLIFFPLRNGTALQVDFWWQSSWIMLILS